MPELPDRPNLDQLRRQARELLRAAADGEPSALTRIHAISERVSLSAAQLAVARGYGFSSWPALHAEVERRLAELPPRGEGTVRASARWSFGGAAAIETAAGTLYPGALVAGPGHAALDASLMPTAQAQQRPPAPAHDMSARAAWARAAGEAMYALAEAITGAVTLTDDQGAAYMVRVEAISGSPARQDQERGLITLRLGVDPVPARALGWLELHGQDGSAARLLPSARPQTRVGHVVPVPDSPARRELPEGAGAWSSMTDAANGADGPQQHLDICAALPAVDDIVVRIDSLVCEPGFWKVYLRAEPGWWTYSEDGGRKWEVMSVRAEDDLGGMYLSQFGGSTGHSDHEELVLRFLPRLDPLARALTLTFSRAGQQVSVELRLP